MNISKINLAFYILFFSLGSIWQLAAQSDKEFLLQFSEQDQEAINALVLYPREVRVAILETTLHPEALVRLDRIQSQTSNTFRELLEEESKPTQEMLWDLTRYPNLIQQLARLEERSDAAVNQLLRDYPEVIHPRASEAVTEHFPLLIEIDQLNQEAEAAVATMLNQYSPVAKEAFRQLIALPEVLSILTDNIRLTVLAGDLYSKNPSWVLHKTDSLSLEVARQNAEELEDWKESLEKNPQIKEELEASAETFATENNYDDEYYDYEENELASDNETEEVVVRYYMDYHYPYWFGYPYWYSYPRWRLYPYWYDWGFYYGSGSTVVVIGMPSYYFTNWYFYHPHHHFRWGHLSAHYVNHYYGHRGSSGSITTSVKNWEIKNRGIVTKEWMMDDGRLSNRFEEFGKLETARIKYNDKNPEKPLSQNKYLERNPGKYPELAKADRTKVIGKTSKPEPSKPNYVPRPTEKDVKKQPTPQPKKYTPPVRDKATVRPEKRTPSRVIMPKVNDGRNYHKNSWEQPKVKSRKPTKPSVSPKPAPKTKIKTNVQKKEN